MAGIRIEFSQFGHFDYFEIIRSDTSMSGLSDLELPAPIVSNLKTMYYVDTDMVGGATYYYKVRVFRDIESVLSNEIIVKATEGDEYSDNVISLLKFDGSIVDEKDRVWTSLAAPVFSADGFQLNNNDLGTPYTSDFEWFNDNYTIEGFVKASDWSSWSVPGLINGIPLLIGRMGQTNDVNQWSFGPVSSGKVHFYYFSGGQKLLISSNNTLPTNELVHISFCKDANNAYVSIAGVVTSLALPSSIALPVVSENISVGCYNYSRITGFLGGLRITKGVARYTSNFNPPQKPFLS
jgi:hypothetical protein